MKKRHKLAAHILFLLVLLNCIALLFIFVWIILLKPPKTPQTPPSEVFRRYVLDPIPESVTNIRADRPSIIFGYTYTFRFNINRDDLALLTNSRPFIRVWNVKYEDGSLNWGWGRVEVEGLVIPEGSPLDIPKYGLSMSLYSRARKPKWFRPELWDNPEAYGLYKIGDLVNTEVVEHDKENSRESKGGTNIQVLLYNEKEGEAYFIVSSHS